MVSWLLTPTTESGQTLKVRVLSLFRLQMHQGLHTSTLLANGQQFGVSMPHSYSIICQNVSQNSGKCYAVFSLNFSFITAKRIWIKTSLKQRHGGQDLGGAPMCCPCEARTYPPGAVTCDNMPRIGSEGASPGQWCPEFPWFHHVDVSDWITGHSIELNL